MMEAMATDENLNLDHAPSEMARVASPSPPLTDVDGVRVPSTGRWEGRWTAHVREIRDFFNRRAADWDRTQDAVTLERSRRLVLSMGIEPGWQVLDVGCGTGILIPGLLEAVGPEGSVCAVDVAEEMLKVARSKLQRPNLHYLQADIAATPFLDGSFDLVVCHNCFPHVADKGRAIREMFRVLRLGGRAVISHTEDRETVNARHIRLGGAVGGDFLPDEATMRRWFGEAGFEVLRVLDGREGYLLEALKPHGIDSQKKPGPRHQDRIPGKRRKVERGGEKRFPSPTCSEVHMPSAEGPGAADRGRGLPGSHESPPMADTG